MPDWAEDAHWMRQALAIGRRHQGRTGSNPSVGCVIIRDGRLLGRGVTALGGAPHAETEAIKAAGDVKGATAYVTLEPCAHQGRTGPCAMALAKAGIARVVIATGDPNPQVAGKGIAILQDAGISITTGILEAEARWDLAGFLKRFELGLPFVTLKLATTLDGRIATATGHSQWITGPAARHKVQHERLTHDAVMVGIGTVLADDPDLRARVDGIDAPTARIILDSNARFPNDAKMLETAKTNPVYICHSMDATPTVTGQSIPIEKDENGSVKIKAALEACSKLGLHRIFAEGGGKVAASLLQAGLVDRLLLFTAGKVIGSDGHAAIAGLGLENLDAAPHLRLYSHAQIGDDVMTEWRKI